MRKIKTIEPRASGPIVRKRVAAYARVSSGKDAMLQSLSSQISYYNSYISGRGDWEFVSVYADEALTGTKDSRPEFQRLLADCRAGKIDMVIAKSITRFARNTVILLETARELKMLGIAIFFEKENIHTMSGDGELMLTLLASFAQEESLSASENQKWRIRRRFEQGRIHHVKMLGYRMFDGQLYIIPSEADIVRQIFADYLSGMGINTIMKKLNRAGSTTIYDNKWCPVAVHTILRNEKYTGDMLLQKTYRLDHLSKKKMVNRGALPMYHVENSHEAIVSKEDFAAVQSEIARRAERFAPKPPAQQQHIFTGLIRCGQCGKNYRHRIARANSKYQKSVWMCANFYVNGKNACSSQQIPENILIAKTKEILGLAALDAETLRRHISAIHIPANNQLVYVFTDGRTEEVHWQNPSRSYSWTPEMKQAARERELARIEGRRQE